MSKLDKFKYEKEWTRRKGWASKLDGKINKKRLERTKSTSLRNEFAKHGSLTVRSARDAAFFQLKKPIGKDPACTKIHKLSKALHHQILQLASAS